MLLHISDRPYVSPRYGPFSVGKHTFFLTPRQFNPQFENVSFDG